MGKPLIAQNGAVGKTSVEPHKCIICGAVFTPLKFRKAYGHFRPYNGAKTCSYLCLTEYKREAFVPIRKKLAALFVGSANHNWKGGTLWRKNRGYRGPHWTANKRKALERDKYRCQDCGMTQDHHISLWKRSLDVHHIEPFHNFPNSRKANALSNLRTLCKPCHRRADAVVKGVQLLLPMDVTKVSRAQSGSFRGVRNGRAKITEDDVRAIRKANKSGVRQVDLAKKYGINQQSVSFIVTRQTWSHVA